MSSNQITKRTLQDRETLKNKSVYSVPDNPSNKGFSAHQLKSKIADPTLLLFDWVKQLSEESFESFENFGSRLEQTVRETADKIYDDDFIAGHQATATVVRNALTNLNGRVLTKFEATLTTVIGGYTVFIITKSGNKLDEEQAKDYMEYMTGSRFLPVFEYEKPQNSMWIMADGSFWKPQYDAESGMLLYAIPSPFELQTNKVNTISNTSTHTQYPSAKAVYDAITAIKKNSFRSVDTTTYATEEAFLESTGEEGYMYLYPKDTSDLSKGYHQYIWEVSNNVGVWIYMGDTNLDLTPYIDKASDQTITGEKTFNAEVYFTDETGQSSVVNSIKTDQYGGMAFIRAGLTAFGVGGADVRFYSRHLLPNINNTSYSLGASNSLWKDAYLSGKIYLDSSGNYTIYKDATTIRIDANGNPIGVKGTLRPTGGNAYDLGTYSLTWKDIWQAGKHYFGYATTDYTLAERNWYAYYNVYNEFVIGRTYNSIAQDFIFINGGSVYSKGTNPELGQSTRKWKNGWIENFKGVVTMTQAAYDALVSGNTVDADMLYFIEEE